MVSHFSRILESSCVATAEGRDRYVSYKCPLLPDLVSYLAKFVSSLVTVVVPVHLGTGSLMGLLGGFCKVQQGVLLCIVAQGQLASGLS